MKAKSIEEFFATLLYSVTEVHKAHLKTNSYSQHKALNEFYDEAPDIADDIIETYQGVYGVVDIEGNGVSLKGDDAQTYFKNLRTYVIDSRDEFIDEDDTEIWSCIDDFLGLIDSTLYKLNELTENMSLHESMRGMRSLSSFIFEKCNGKSCKEDEKKPKKESCNITEEEVTDEKSFREYAEAILKKMHGDDYDEEKAKKVIDGMIKDKKDDEDWGVLVGKLQKC